MAPTSIELNTEQQFSDDPSQETLLAEIVRLRRLSELTLEGAETMTRLSLNAFALAREGEPRANRFGSDFLDCAERFFASGRSLMADADALAARART